MNKASFRQKLRIILAITAKDTLEALKNRTILALVFSILVLMLSAKVMPFLLALRGQPTLAIHAPAGFAALHALENRQDMQLVRCDSEQEMKSLLVETDRLIFGLVIPADAALDSGSGEVQLNGYTPNRASPAWVREQAAFFESVLSGSSGMVIHIEVEGHVVYPSVEPGLHLMMVTQTAALMILLMGLMLVPYLFLEEKEQHTLDALLVSPASYSQLVTGKALAGAVYCLITAAAVMLFNFRIIVHWDLALLAVMLGSAFAILTGLLLGILVENQAALGMWMGLLLVILAGPSLVTAFGSAKLPAAVASFLSWTPGAAFNSLLKYSMYGPVQVMAVVRNAAVLVAGSVVMYGLVVWRVGERRAER